MEGIATCRKCGNTVRGEIGIDLICPYCGRVFQIPDEPIYYMEKPAPLQKLKDVPIMSLSYLLLDGQKTSSDDFFVEFNFSVQPINEPAKKNGAIRSNWKCFAHRPQPDLFVEGEKVLIVADLPDHKKNQVSIKLGRGCLSIESLRPHCRYAKEFVIPDWAKRIASVNTHNGLLIVEISKGP